MRELRDLRAVLYGSARALGWIIAASRGPEGLVRRAGRVAIWRNAGRWINRL